MREIPHDYTLLFDVWVVANSTRALLDDALRASGLSAEEFALYSAVNRSGGSTPTELAKLMALAPTTVSSILVRLEGRGHMLRTPNPNDDRSYRIQLTTAGQTAHRKASRLFAPVLARVDAALLLPVAEAHAILDAINIAVNSAMPAQRGRQLRRAAHNP